MQKILKLALVFLILLPIGVNTFKNKANAQTQNEIHIKSKQFIEYPIKNMPEKVVQEYKNSCWNITEKGAYRDVNLSEGDVYINGKKHEINSHGIVKIDNIKNEKLNISSDGKNENRATVVSNNGEKTATFDINANQIIDNMDKGTHTVTQEAGYGKKYKKGEWVHCNRFNGPQSDNVHYAKSNPKAMVNFAGSDCDKFLLRSTKCYGHSYCNIKAKAAACSSIIGHSTKYHHH